jgi:tripartite-type tricarboxylate transporter receptor subunit TctC
MIQGMQYAHSSKLTAIGITSAKRSPAMPELPSIAESGLPGYDFSTWYALLVHANVPKPTLARLHAATVKALSRLQGAFDEIRHRDRRRIARGVDRLRRIGDGQVG